MLKYLTKFAVDILPSVAATVIGAYIVNHYIATKPAADAPVAAAASTADPKPAAKPAEVGNLPAAGVKAKGISEKAMIEKTASERPAAAEKPVDSKSVDSKSGDSKSGDSKSGDSKSAETKPVDTKPAEPPAETASIPAEPRRHQPAPRDKVRVVLPSPVQPAAVQPAVAAVPNPAPPVEPAATPEERRDATDLARAAIERLRGTGDSASRPQQEAVRAPEPSRAPEAVRAPETPRVVSAPALRPLPPPIMVSTPPSENLDQGSQPKPPYAANAGVDDPRRPVPPADIPVAPRPPLDLRAEAVEPPATKERTTVADDMLSAAKSVFHAVLPK